MSIQLSVTDALSMTNARTSVANAYGVIEAVQRLPAAQQVAAASVAFVAICKELDLDPADVFHTGYRILEDAKTLQTNEARALTEYVREEIRTGLL